MIKDFVNRIIEGDSLEVVKTLPDESIDCVVTSPPYWGLRDYGNDGQLGLEKTPEEYVAKMVFLFSKIKRVLKNDGTVWLNLGDTYNGSGENRNGKNSNSFKITPSDKEKHGLKREKYTGLKLKDLVGIPWRVAFALQAEGWYLRQDIIWNKPTPMPESVTDRCTKSHEYIFLLSKSAKYFFDSDAIKEPAALRGHERWQKNENGERVRNKRSVWTINTQPFPQAHFAVYPPALIVDCIKAGCPVGGIVLDPFSGAGTTAFVARKLGRNYVGIELNSEYIKITERRLQQSELPLIGIAT